MRNMDGQTDGHDDSYIPPKIPLWGYFKTVLQWIFRYS